MTDQAIDQGLAYPVDQAGETVQSDRLERAFRAEGLAGLKLATMVRMVALATVAVMLFYIVPVPMVFYYEALLAVFIVIGFMHYWLSRSPDSAPPQNSSGKEIRSGHLGELSQSGRGVQ